MSSKVFSAPWNAEPEPSTNDCDAAWFESGKWHASIAPVRNNAAPSVSKSWQVVDAGGILVAKGLTKRNAILIAAAPTMLADLQTLAIVVRSDEEVERIGPESLRTIRKIVQGAIVSAKGGV